MGLLVLMLATRELDGAFDVLLIHGAWKWIVLAVLVATLIYGVLNWNELVRGASVQAGKFSSGILFSALTAVLVQSRIMGMQDFWREILGVRFSREVPRLIEELLELSGYCLLASSVVEMFFEARRRQ